MASVGWGGATINRKSAQAMGYSWGRRLAGRSRWGRTLSHRFGRRGRGQKKNKTKLIAALGGGQSTIAHNNHEKLRGDRIERAVVEERWAKINPRIAARPLDELIRPLWAESKGFIYIP